MLHYRGGRKMMNMGVYPDMDDFYADVGKAYDKAVHAFYDAGCRYLQLDDISFAYLCDPEQREMLRQRGDDPEKQPEIYAGMVREALKDKPADLTITMHLCRGNFRSTFIASGGYEPVAEMLFNAMPVDGYFMEWDTDRAGGFEPLRFLPKGKPVVLGLVTSKTGTLEKKDDIKRRIDEAAKYVDLDQLCLVAAMRLRLDRGGQHARRGRAMGEAAHDRRDRRRGLGQPRLRSQEGGLIGQARELFRAPSQPLLRAKDIMMQDEPVLDLAHLGHLELLTPKPDESLRFFVDVLGMTESGRQGDSVYLRGWDDYEHHTLKLTASKQAGHGPHGIPRAQPAGAGAPGRRLERVRLRDRLDGWRSRPWPGLPLPGSGRSRRRALLRDRVVSRLRRS